MGESPQGSFRLAKGFFVGSYRVVQPLVDTGLTEKYLVRSTREHRHALLYLVKTTVQGGAEGFRRLSEDVERASGMEHGAIVRMGALEKDAGLVFFTADAVEGPGGHRLTLADEVAKAGGRLDDERVHDVARLLAGALGYAHAFRGTGVVHGGLSAACLAVGSLRQLRLEDFGAWPTQGKTPADDLRSTGELLFRLLTGRSPEPGRAPSAFGADRRWDRIVERCRTAGAAGGYAGAADLARELEEAPAERIGRGGRILTAVICVLVAVAIAAAGILWTRHNAAARVRTEAAAAEAAAAEGRRQRAEESLAAARKAAAEGNAAAALRAVSRVLEEMPDHPEAVSIRAEVATQEGLRRIAPIKERADALWGTVRPLGERAEMRSRFADLDKTLAAARKALTEMDFDLAETRYGEFVEEGTAFLKLEQQRIAANAARLRAEAARENAEGDPAREAAEETWAAAETDAGRGAEAYAAGEFAKAEEQWNRASDGYEATLQRGGGRRLVDTAKAEYEKVIERADATLLEDIPERDMESVRKAVAEAEAHEGAERWPQAAAAYRGVAASLARLLDKTASGRDLAADVAEMTGGTGGARSAYKPGPLRKGDLVANGDFGKGSRKRIDGWSTPDGLTYLYDTGGKPGACILFRTDVQQKDKRALDANPEVIPGRTEGGIYNTVGAHEGVWAFSSPIEITPADKYFVVEADVMGPAKSTALFYPQVFIRGYQAFDAARDEGTVSWFQTPHDGGPAFSEQFGAAQRRARLGDYLMVFRHSLVCRNSDADIWEHYRLAFKLPDDARYRPDVLLLKCYAMWPLGAYRFDNVSLRAVTKDEYDRVRSQGHSIRGFMETAE